jgi:hypothetical protein
VERGDGRKKIQRVKRMVKREPKREPRMKESAKWGKDEPWQ